MNYYCLRDEFTSVRREIHIFYYSIPFTNVYFLFIFHNYQLIQPRNLIDCKTNIRHLKRFLRLAQDHLFYRDIHPIYNICRDESRRCCSLR